MSLKKERKEKPNTLTFMAPWMPRFADSVFSQPVLRVKDGATLRPRHLPQPTLVLVDGGEAVSVDGVEVVLVGDP